MDRRPLFVSAEPQSGEGRGSRARTFQGPGDPTRSEWMLQFRSSKMVLEGDKFYLETGNGSLEAEKISEIKF